MRIAYILTTLSMGGAERQVLDIAKRMADRGHTVRVLVLLGATPDDLATPLDIVRLHMSKSPFAMLKALYSGHRALRAFQPDLVHSHTFPGNMLGRALRFTGAAPRVLSTIHNVYEGGALRMFAYRWTDGLAWHTTAVSEAAAQRFIGLNAVPASKCSVVANAMDCSWFSPDAERRKSVRDAEAVGDAFLWLAAGRPTPAKDYPNLLSAFARVRTTDPRAQLWIAGAGVGASILGDCTEEARQVARDGEAVRWLGMCAEMRALYDAADGFVLASAWEGMPLVVGEAMAMQKPVVATDVGGVRQLAGECADLVPAHDADALALKMLGVERMHRDARAARGRAARARIAELFNMERRVNEWEEIYARMLREQRVNRAWPAA